MSEGACILSGLGYNGVDANGKGRWDRVTNVDPVALELAQNTKAYFEAWNQNTNKWLKNYVYLRVTPKGKKPGFRSSIATFTTSGKNFHRVSRYTHTENFLAMWHGISPGYYMAFITASFVQTAAKRRLYSTNSCKSSNLNRFPPPHPPFLPFCRPKDTWSPQRRLRHIYLYCHPNLLFLCCCSLPLPLFCGLHSDLGKQLLFRPHWHRHFLGLFQLSC